MPYDPIRDRDLPSPATELRSSDWRGQITPGTSASTSQSAEVYGQHTHPPSFYRDERSPSTSSSRNVSGPGGLRGLLNDENSEQWGRGGGERSGASSHFEEDRGRPSLDHLMNPDLAPPISKTNSASSIAHSSSPSGYSPGGRQYNTNPNGFLTPATPASSALRTSRSPNYPAYSTSPSDQVIPLGSAEPPYPVQHPYAETPGPSDPRRRPSAGMPSMPMPPPPNAQVYDPYAHQTPTTSHLPLRSPSVSVSPRSVHPPLPPAYPVSRPGSATSSSHPFFFQPPVPPHASFPAISPATSSRKLSDDPTRPPSANIAGERIDPVRSRRGSQVTHVPVYSPLRQSIRSPSPVIRRTPYSPHRISEPRSVLYPITQDEIASLRQLGLDNNPLRRKKRRQLPSWSGPSPGPGVRSSTQPMESATSYFPSQDLERPSSAVRRSQSYIDRRGSVSSSGRPSITPGPSAVAPAFDEPPIVTPGGSRTMAGRKEAENGNHLKRPSDHDGEREGSDIARRKVGDSHYVGNASAVASHYNSRPEVGVQHREFSPIIGLKKFNNWIKSVLIGKFAWRGHGEGAKVLDIGCGKGGDLNKWRQARISLYVGMDIAATSVDQARNRYETMNRPGFDAYFFAHDCYSLPISDILPDPLKVRDLYDNVTMQFCMHYAFESPSKARMMIENVSRYLRNGGKFIGTIPDGEILLSRLNALPEDDTELKFGNSCYFIQFEERTHKGIYGHKYRFYLEDAVDDVPEYVVNWDNFINLAAEYRLRLVYRKSFNEILQEEQSSRDFGPLLGRMKVINEAGESSMDEDQWEAANLYMAFAFEKF